ncbi:MAG TPA: PHB depolymerase family esterase [Sphingomicrobium sp.]|nr:PHB depolymerase family esterase [Sphingomicrobium sp.]
MAAGLAGSFPTVGPRPSRLEPFTSFGSNPGDLGGWIHVPSNLPSGAPLVVILHGCTQTPVTYDHGAAWSVLADRLGFVALFPGQKRSNNPNLCFNWFSPRDARRDRGEALSIIQMVRAAQQRYGTHPKQTFVTGLSAGGAMTAVMLATYPEVFAAGAVIAGLPFGTANNVPQALERMRGHEMPNASELARLVRLASSFDGPWPRLSVWHGTNDVTVDPTNAAAVVVQWQELHGPAELKLRVDQVSRHTRRVWIDKKGKEVIEEYLVDGMSHGTPLSTHEEDSAEVTGPHMLEAGISSTKHIARFWGLDGRQPKERTAAASKPFVTTAPGPNTAQRTSSEPRAQVARSLRKVIEDALRRGGLMS